MKQLLFERFMWARANAVAARLLPWLPTSGAVLDFGCGTGHNAERLRVLTGLPVAEMDVADLKLVGPQATLLPTETAAVPLAESELEASLLLFVMSYAQDPAQIFRELHRVTGGRLLVLQSVSRSPRFRRLLWVRECIEGGWAWDVARWFRWVRTGRDGLQVRQVFAREELIKLAADQGWSLVHWEPERGPKQWLSRDLFVFEA